MAPTRFITFLGISLDTVLVEARLPDKDKLEKAKTLLDDFQRQQKVTLRVPQSLIDILNFACTVIVPGRAFLRRIIDMTVGVQKPHHHIRLTRQAKLDLQVWQEFLLLFNGRSFFLDDNFLTGDHLHLYTDASGSTGFGALYGAAWFYGQWPVSWRSYNISVLELYRIMAAVIVWGGRRTNRSVCFYPDNEALVPIINKQTSREPHIMSLIRPLVLACLRFNINFTARHIPGRINTLADKLSRSHSELWHHWQKPARGKFPTVSPQRAWGISESVARGFTGAIYERPLSAGVG